jgi:hypothetical protein
VAQGVGPQFKSQDHKKKEINSYGFKATASTN